MSHRDGTPLPDVLSGNVIERVIRLDSSLLYLVTGALSYLCDRESLEPTGALTTDEAKAALSDMLWVYLTEEAVPAYLIGEIKVFAGESIPDGWLLCEGQAAHRVTYAALFAATGTYYGAGDGSTTFNLPDMRGAVIVGTGHGGGYKTQPLGTSLGEAEHVLIEDEMPTHNHPPLTGNSFIVALASGGTANTQAGTTQRRGDATTGNAGGNQPHNNMQPYVAMNVAIYTGVLT